MHNNAPVTAIGMLLALMMSPALASAGGTSTPYLLIKSDGKYYLENDVMETYKNQSIEIAKQGYERNSGDPLKFRQEDYYKLRLNPDISKSGVKFQIKELEPEESHIDQVRLVRVIHPKGTYAFVDLQSNTLKAIKRALPISPVKCTLKGTDCLEPVSRMDDRNIEANKKDSMSLEFNVKDTDIKNLYLTVNTWEKSTIKPPPAPLKAKASMSLQIFIYNPSTPERTVRLKDLHPRAIPAQMDLALGDALKNFTGNKLGIKFVWTDHLFVDYAALMESKPVSVKKEELSLKKAVNSKNKDVLWRLLRKDKIYVHTVRGHQLDLTFAHPRKVLKQSEMETYFFVSSGYCHGLRAHLYPKIDPSEDSFKKELQPYIDDLHAFLKNKKQ